MNTLRAFLFGLAEFRSSFTTHFPEQAYAYDLGREIAHRLTFRRYET